MSFSGDVKKELLTVLPSARHCQLAELAAGVLLLADRSPEREALILRTENEGAANKLFTLLKKAFNIDIVVNRRRGNTGGKHGWIVSVEDADASAVIRKTLNHRRLLAMECCRRAFLRGAFLASGSVSAPEKAYHLEITASEESTAERIREVMQSLDLDAKIVIRKEQYVVYLKEGEQLVQMLGEMGANISLLNFENIRIYREMRGSVNRRVNCETANLKKTAVSSYRQIEDIQYIQNRKEFASLPPALQEMAEVRLQYPDAPLAELGSYLEVKIGKSGVNHRLRKISEFADRLREKELRTGAEEEKRSTL